MGHGMALAYMCANVVVVLLTWWFLSRENRKKELAEAQAGMQVVDDEEWHGDDDVRWRFTV